MPNTDFADFVERRSAILARIEAEKRAAGRTDPVCLVGVSKVQPEARIEAALAAGQTVFGENRVQEAQARWGPRLKNGRNISLRLIGPLQTNKALDAVGLFDVIETLDRPKLAKALAKAMEKLARRIPCLIQVNTGEEKQKAGVFPADLSELLGEATDLGLDVQGLMCIPPVSEPSGPHFALLAKLAEAHQLKTLSMGMSGDFETAIRFGATHIRVGSALFGARGVSAA